MHVWEVPSMYTEYQACRKMVGMAGTIRWLGRLAGGTGRWAGAVRWVVRKRRWYIHIQNGEEGWHRKVVDKWWVAKGFKFIW